MNKRFIGVLIFAFTVALGASLVLYRVLVNRPQTTKAAPTMVQVAVAAHDLEVGSVLKEEDVKLSDWPGVAPVGSTQKIQDLVGRGVIVATYAKEPIIESRLAGRGAGGGLASMIPKGMRAVAIRVNEVVGVAGFVVPGMRVDVLISGNTPGGDGNLGTLTRTLLQNLEVLSAGQDFKKDQEGKPIMVQVVNMLVTPEQAEQLSLASSQTSIQLVLRNPLDREVAKTPGTAMRALFAGGRINIPPVGTVSSSAPRGSDIESTHRSSRPVAPRVPNSQPASEVRLTPKKEAPFVMEIISGTRRNDTKFDNKSGEDK